LWPSRTSRLLPHGVKVTGSRGFAARGAALGHTVPQVAVGLVEEMHVGAQGEGRIVVAPPMCHLGTFTPSSIRTLA
jgi:hypothetical protein